MRWQAHRGCCEPRGPWGEPKGMSDAIDPHDWTEAQSPQGTIKTHLDKELASVYYMFSK